MFKRFNEFRIVEETDLIREVLRGYNEYVKDEFKNDTQYMFDKIEITDHTKLLSLDEAKQQCVYMKKSLENIVARQQRKGIPSIINGVHIIPEILNGIACNRNIIYVNLFVTNENELYDRIINRNPSSYMLNHIPFIFQTNCDLYKSTEKLTNGNNYIFNNIDVTELSVNETINEIINRFKKRISLI